MNYSEVKELLNAGFNAEEIRAMLNPQNPQDNTQPEEPEQAQEPEQVQEPEQEQQPDDTKFTQLNDTMTKILKAIQGNNLQNNSFDKRTETDINTEVDKIMGSLIRPEREKGD